MFTSILGDDNNNLTISMFLFSIATCNAALWKLSKFHLIIDFKLNKKNRKICNKNISQ